MTALANEKAEEAKPSDVSGSEAGTKCDRLTDFPKGGPPREEGSGNYKPDPQAEGPHTTLGTREGTDGRPYTQGAIFDGNGNFTGRTDVSDHGSPWLHVNPH